VFDVNDFDETLPGPFEWDVKLLAASLAVAGRANGFNRKARRSGGLPETSQSRYGCRPRASRRGVRRFRHLCSLSGSSASHSPSLSHRGLTENCCRRIKYAVRHDARPEPGQRVREDLRRHDRGGSHLSQLVEHTDDVDCAVAGQ
jgi:hypothetical protein